MEATIEYFPVTILDKDINVPDVGEVALEATTHIGTSYFIINHTLRGYTYTVTFGPLVMGRTADDYFNPVVPKSFNLNYSISKYNDKRLEMELSRWAVMPSKGAEVEDIRVVDMEDALSVVRKLGTAVVFAMGDLE